MLTWPHPQTDWADQLDRVEQLYLEISHAICRRQELLIVCRDPRHQHHVKHLLEINQIPLTAVILAVAPFNDTWARDHGPLTVEIENGARVCDFRFNGWGGKYPAELDDRITGTLAATGLFDGSPCQSVNLVLEGGAIETDGAGTLLATRSSILTESRNPGMTAEEVEKILQANLGLDRFLWLESGHLSGDDTDGHIDTLARFCDPHTILYVTAHEGDPDRPELEAMAAELAELRQRNGTGYRLIPLPPILPQYDDEGQRMPASYANFLIINGAVLMPVYGDPSDEAAILCAAQAFPDREIIGIDCRPLIHQHGSLHCISMQFPAALTIRPQENH